jgi:hypothetical protein
MRCRAVICTECCTRVDGVNHCHACLKALGTRTQQPAAAGFPTGIFALCVIGLAWLCFFGIAWLIQGSLAP